MVCVCVRESEERAVCERGHFVCACMSGGESLEGGERAVCVRERRRELRKLAVCERGERERDFCVCLRERERERERERTECERALCVCMYVRGEGELCVCVRGRRES